MWALVSVAWIFAWIACVSNFKSFRKESVESIIASYPFPISIQEKLRKTYPHLSPRDLDQVLAGLREYFCICNAAGRRFVSIPSQAVDVAWHEFILATREYEQFCKRAFGWFLHHAPTHEAESPDTVRYGIKRAWWHACSREGIDPQAATRLPLLFAIDTQLDIADGFKYSLDCLEQEILAYFAVDFAVDVECGGCGGCGGGDGGGDGGGGDGGG